MNKEWRMVDCLWVRENVVIVALKLATLEGSFAQTVGESLASVSTH